MAKSELCFLLGYAVLAAQTVQVNGQDPDAGLALLHKQGPDMDERTLQEKYHIAATEEGLIGALQHEQPAVRSFAAMKLASDGDKAAIRPILDAMATEKLQGVRTGLATAAAQLGSNEGFNDLKNMCEDRSGSPTTRMIAAQSMTNSLGKPDCLSDVLDVLRSVDATGEDYPAANIALNLLIFQKFREMPPSQLDEARDLCAAYLKNQNPGLRIDAGLCIRDQGGPWAISQLRAAIDGEREEAVRNALEKDLLSVRQ